MPDDFVIARNPEENTSLPYLVRIPLGPDGVVLKARETWPRTNKLYCHPAQWPAEPEIIERVPTLACSQRGAAIDLVLDRGRENRSQFVITLARGRQMIFWQTARVAKQARPNVRTPQARGFGIREVEIIVDVRERYAWKFNDQQVTTRSAPLTAGDYAVAMDGEVVAVVERKSLADLAATLTGGKGVYLFAALAAVPRAAVVVEDRYSAVFALKHVRPAVVLDKIAETQARFPTVPIIFAETRKLAQEWTYRFFTASLREGQLVQDSHPLLESLPAGELPPREPTTAEIRAWARASGYPVTVRGKLPPEIVTAYHEAHP